jgi:hypothetical protein
MLLVQHPLGVKVSGPEIREKMQNSLEKSKGVLQLGMWRFESSRDSHPVCDLENFSVSCEKGPPMAGFSREVILYRDRFCGNATVIDQYSPTV